MRRLVAVVIGATLVATVVAGIALAATVRDLHNAQNVQQDDLVPARLELARLLSVLVDQETSERGYVLTANVTYLAPYDTGTAQVAPILAEIAVQTSTVPGMADDLAAIKAAHDEWRDQAAEPEIAAVRSGDRDQAEALVAKGAGKVLFDYLRQAHVRADDRLGTYEASVTDRVTALSQRLTALLAGTLTLLAALAALAAFTVERSVLRPLRRIGTRVRLVSSGRLDEVVESTGPREFRELADDVDTMRRRLIDEIGSARRATEALALREPTVAALQAALAPALASVPGVEVAARLEPAEGVLAGDFVDTVVLEGGRLGVVVGDVAGHGPGAAVFGLRLKLLLGSLLESGIDPSEVLEAAVARLSYVTDETFATVLVAVVDPHGGSLTYANAGHPAPVLLGSDAAEPEVQGELTPTGPFLSPMFPTAHWEARTVPFASSDLLLAYTDGVVEARDGSGRELGLEPTVAALIDLADDDELDGVLDALFNEVRDHAATLRDDTTLVLVRATGAPVSVGGGDGATER